MKAVCDKCDKVFKVSMESKEHMFHDIIKLKEVFFVCPECNHKYVAYYESKESMEIQEQIDIMKRSEDNNLEELVKLREKKKEVLTLIKNHMNSKQVMAYGIFMSGTGDEELIELWLTKEKANKQFNLMNSYESIVYYYKVVEVKEGYVVDERGNQYKLKNL